LLFDAAIGLALVVAFAVEGRLAMAPNLTVEMCTPGEIVDSRRSFSAETTKGLSLLPRRGSPTEVRMRMLDAGGAIAFDLPVAEV
jgi:pilus assembly protein Flp/PilA